MNPIYATLFDSYGDSVLRDMGVYDEDEIDASLDALSVDKDTKLALGLLLFKYYYRWSTDAFALGLHLGLSLRYDDVCRARPQQVQ